MPISNGQESSRPDRFGKQLERERRARSDAESVAQSALAALLEKQRESLLLQTIAEASNQLRCVEDVLHLALQQICSYTGWPVGHVYMVSREDPTCLLPSKLWFLEQPDRFENFRRVTEATVLAVGLGLPGQVMAAGRSVWIHDLAGDSNFPRLRLAHDIGVRSGFAFPVLLGREVAAVLEFFSAEMAEPDENLLEVTMRIGMQLGRVIERQRAEEALKKSEKEFRRVWEDSLDGMRLTDERGVMLQVNDAFCKLVGKSEAELVGQPFSIIYEAGDSSAVLARHRERFATRDVKPLFERELLLWHGRKVWFELSNTFLENPPQPAQLLSIFRDVTERKLAEERLREFATKLERSNRELEDFAFVASHDLQEPLRKVAVFGDRLQAKYGPVLDSEGCDYVHRMQSAAARMQSLITDLLMLSCVTSRSQPFVPVDLNKIADGVLLDLEASIEQTGGEIEMGTLGMIEAEPVQMRQLFQNLIGNALKFHRPDEKPIVKIGAKVLQDSDSQLELNGKPREMLQLAFCDNGIGFDEKYLDKIFHVFQTLHNREAYEGTGMGLAITRKIVEHHGGEITAQSKPNAGATFVVTLPIKQRRSE